MSRAVIGRGKYTFRPGFKKLKVSEATWFSMKEKTRKRHLCKVANTNVWEMDMDEIENSLASQEPSAESAGPRGIPGEVLSVNYFQRQTLVLI